MKHGTITEAGLLLEPTCANSAHEALTERHALTGMLVSVRAQPHALLDHRL